MVRGNKQVPRKGRVIIPKTLKSFTDVVFPVPSVNEIQTALVEENREPNDHNIKDYIRAWKRMETANCVDVDIQPIQGRGHGVVARRNLHADFLLAFYPGVFLPENAISGSHIYAVGVRENDEDVGVIEPADMRTSYKRLLPRYNHHIAPRINEASVNGKGISQAPNCIIIEDQDKRTDSPVRLQIRTSRPVRRGEELLLSYGSTYGDARGYTPSPHCVSSGGVIIDGNRLIYNETVRRWGHASGNLERVPGLHDTPDGGIVLQVSTNETYTRAYARHNFQEGDIISRMMFLQVEGHDSRRVFKHPVPFELIDWKYSELRRMATGGGHKLYTAVLNKREGEDITNKYSANTMLYAIVANQTRRGNCAIVMDACPQKHSSDGKVRRTAIVVALTKIKKGTELKFNSSRILMSNPSTFALEKGKTGLERFTEFKEGDLYLNYAK